MTETFPETLSQALPATMLGLELPGNERVVVKEYPTPRPRGDWVVIAVRAALLCGSESAAYRGGGFRGVPGNEFAGEVVAVDRQARLRPGDRVFVYPIWGCGRCALCAAGDVRWCPDRQFLGRGKYDGAYAEYALVPEACCLPVPDGVPFVVAALFFDGIGTPYHAIKRLGVSAFDTVVITGIGALGAGALAICKLLGARVLAVEAHPLRRERALALGADHVVDADAPDAVAHVRALTPDGRGADKAIECRGKEAAENLALDTLRVRGHAAFIGQPRAATLAVGRQIVTKEVEVIGSWVYNVAEYGEIVGLVRRGLPADRLITHRFPLAQAPEAFALFNRGLTGKVALLPGPRAGAAEGLRAGEPEGREVSADE